MRLRVGRLTKPHGLKGGLRVEMFTDEPDTRFYPGAKFILKVPEDSPWFDKKLTLKELRWYNNVHPVAFFEEIPDRTVAESAVKAIMYIDHNPDDLPAEPDAWYDHQLVGLKVKLDGRTVGIVRRVDHFPAQDLLAVESYLGNQQEVLLPFVKAIVPSVDIAAGTLEITPPPGLLNPDEAEEVVNSKSSLAKHADAAEGTQSAVDASSKMADSTDTAE